MKDLSHLRLYTKKIFVQVVYSTIYLHLKTTRNKIFHRFPGYFPSLLITICIKNLHVAPCVTSASRHPHWSGSPFIALVALVALVFFPLKVLTLIHHSLAISVILQQFSVVFTSPLQHKHQKCKQHISIGFTEASLLLPTQTSTRSSLLQTFSECSLYPCLTLCPKLQCPSCIVCILGTKMYFV